MRCVNSSSGGVSRALIAFIPCLRAVESTLGSVAKCRVPRSVWKHLESLHAPLHHAQVLVGGRHLEVGRQAQRRPLAVPQPQRQVDVAVSSGTGERGAGARACESVPSQWQRAVQGMQGDQREPEAVPEPLASD